MKDESKTKNQLIRELTELRQKITESLNTDPERSGIHPSPNEYEIRYRTLFDRSLFCVYLHDLQGNLFDANETALNLFGYAKKELPSLNILSLIPEEQRPIALQRIEQIVKSGAQKRPFEYKVKKKDGEYLWMEVEGALIVKHGKPYAIQGIARDITERKKAEEELLLIHQEWENIFHAIGHPTIILDKQHNILSANSATVKAVGAGSQEELLGRKCYEIFHNASEPPQSCPLMKMLTSIKFEESEMEVEALGGVFLVSCTPVFDEQGDVQKIIHIATDITKRKRAEESLHTSEERFRALTENTSDWIWEVDQSFVFTYVSPKIKDLLGYEPNEIIGKTPFDLMTENEAKRISEIAHSIMAYRKPFVSVVNINLHKDGRQVILETNGIPIFDKNGKFSGYRGIDRDITERKRAEEALQDSEQRFRTLFEQSMEAQLLLNHDGKVVDCNDAFLDLFAIKDKAEVMGYRPEDFAPEFQPDGTLSREMGDEILKTVMEQGSAQYEWAHFKHDKKRTPVITELICTRIFIAGQPMLHTSIRDTTERKKSENALKKNEKELKARVKELEEFYDMAVGREIRMKQLKEENNKLREELEKYKKL